MDRTLTTRRRATFARNVHFADGSSNISFRCSSSGSAYSDDDLDPYEGEELNCFAANNQDLGQTIEGKAYNVEIT